jgi:natural resistance-associated macrophage protein
VLVKHLLQLTDRLPASKTSLTLNETSLSFSGDIERPCALRKVILAVDNASPTGPGAGVTPDAVTDPQHVGDIVGALGTLKRGAANSRSWRRKIRSLLVIMGPDLIVMGGGNDAGGVQVYAQMGQDYGMRLLWTLILLFPILFFCQEMVVRLGAVSGVGHGRLIFARFGKFWGTFSVADLFIINAVTVVAEFIGVEQALSFFGLPAGPRWRRPRCCCSP